MKPKTLIVNLFLLLAFSCDDKENQMNTDKLTVTYGHICGWCSGLDSITVSQVTTSLFYDYYCGDSVINRSDITKQDLWSLLKQNINKDEFQKISLNTCYVCVDGCDTWITVSSDNYYHKIRYGYRDINKLNSIKPFIEVLDSIRTSVVP